MAIPLEVISTFQFLKFRTLLSILEIIRYINYHLLSSASAPLETLQLSGWTEMVLLVVLANIDYHYYYY